MNKIKNQEYSTPVIKVVSFTVEHGFQASLENLNQGTDYSNSFGTTSNESSSGSGNSSNQTSFIPRWE